MSCSLLLLYPSIMVPILFEWSTDEDLCYLDTAVCSQTHRKGILSLMRKGKLVNTNTDLSERSEVETWIRLRQSTPSIVSYDLKSGHIELKSCVLNRLSSRSSNSGEDVLDEILRSGIALDYLRLHGRGNAMNETFKKYGHLVTNFNCYEVSGCPEVASFFPNLKELISHNDDSLLSFVEMCPLDFIGHCNIAALNGSTARWNYCCDLQRTTDCTDETTVCLGDDKYYHMTALYWRKLSDEDRKTLRPLLSHVKSVLMNRDTSNNMWLAANCHNLTFLDVKFTSDNGGEVVLALQRCKQLKTLRFDIDVSIEVVNALFGEVAKCASLRFIKLHHKFHLPYLAVVDWFDDVVSSAVYLKVSRHFATHLFKKARGIDISSLKIDRSVVSHLLLRCPNLTRIAFYNMPILNDALLNEIHRCPNLTSFSVMKCLSLTDGGIASALSWCTNLHLLALVDVKLSNATLTDLLHRNRLLRYLDVEKCQQISDEVMSSIKSCPLLRYLNVKDTAVTDVGYSEWRSRVGCNFASLTNIKPIK